MNGRLESKGLIGKVVLTIGLGALGMALTERAVAGCGMFDAAGRETTNWSPPQAGKMMAAVYVPGAGRFIHVSDGYAPGEIVGMWNVSFTSDGTSYPAYIPVGVTLDFATIQYHSDGTEFQISGSRPPSTGDVCMGVWKQTGDRTYKVKHVALAWVSGDSTPPASPAAFLGPGVFHEEITLSRSGNTFEGTVTIDQYASDGVSLIEHIGGTMSGTRFTVD